MYVRLALVLWLARPSSSPLSLLYFSVHSALHERALSHSVCREGWVGGVVVRSCGKAAPIAGLHPR